MRMSQKKSRLRCTLLLQWEQGYEHRFRHHHRSSPGAQANVAWYGVRTWVEAGEKRCEARRLGLASLQNAGCQSD